MLTTSSGIRTRGSEKFGRTDELLIALKPIRQTIDYTKANLMHTVTRAYIASCGGLICLFRRAQLYAYSGHVAIPVPSDFSSPKGIPVGHLDIPVVTGKGEKTVTHQCHVLSLSPLCSRDQQTLASHLCTSSLTSPRSFTP